ncbi:MAG TPA: alpha-ketoacid dehydrogenase subunit beta [Chloroflexia bacterium]|jgi:2-oxoisovalerate dehydrogenase E1 component beta subunit|nr:alpha-ketoacid dehydrogenase subunit beta [Chloroflexia bacterium]
MAVKTMIEAIRDGLREEMERDERVFVLGEDVGPRGGVFGVTDGFFKQFGGDRVMDTPLAESVIAGAAIGAAMNGMRPVAEMQFADFSHPAMDQIMNEAAKIRYRSNNSFNVPLVIRMPYGGGIHGALYHSQSVEALYGHIPGLTVVIPSNPYDAKGLLKAAIRDPDPVIFLEHKGAYRLIKGEVPDEDYTVPLGKAAVAREGSDMTAIAYGMMLFQCLKCADEMAKEGVEVEVVDVRTISPLDRETILNSVKKTGKALVVYEDNRSGGWGAEISASIAEAAFPYLDGPIVRVTGPDIPAMPYNHNQEAYFMPNPEKILKAMRELAAY